MQTVHGLLHFVYFVFILIKFIEHLFPRIVLNCYVVAINILIIILIKNKWAIMNRFLLYFNFLNPVLRLHYIRFLKSKFPANEFSICQIIHNNANKFAMSKIYLTFFKIFRQMDFIFLYVFYQLVYSIISWVEVLVPDVCEWVFLAFLLISSMIFSITVVETQAHEPIAQFYHISDF